MFETQKPTLLSRWRAARFSPLIFSLFVTPFALLTAVLSGGAGHGDYFLAKVLFPYTMLATIFTNIIVKSTIVLAIFQYPLYGLLLSLAKARKAVAIVLLLVHLVAMLGSFLLIGENFS